MIFQKPRNRSLTLFLILLPPLLLLTLQTQPNFLNRCSHIIVISVPNHGAERLLSSAENCGAVTPSQSLWSSSNTTVEEALNLVSTTSVTLFPEAVYNHSADVRTFLRHATGSRVPVLVLRRPVEQAWQGEGDLRGYARDVKGYFGHVTKLMRVSGVPWDDISFEMLGKREIYVGGHDCYINNCDV